MNLPVSPACQLVPQATIFTLVKFRNTFLGDIHLVEENLRGIERHAGEKSVANGAGLLEDFLLHVMLVAALFGHDRVPGDMLDGSLDGVAIEIQDADALWSEHRNVAIGQEKHFLVWARIAGMSLATKYSPCPRPITEGGPVRAATILFGSWADRMARE